MKEETKIKYAEICRQWDEMGLSNTPALYAARRLGVDPCTLRIALKVYRKEEYDPNKFKSRKPRVYVYQKCKYCGADTSIRIDISTVDEAENKKLGKTSIYVCKNCIMKKFV